MDEGARRRHAAAELISQRLYSIILAAHAAEARSTNDPDRMDPILRLIATQSAAALEDLHGLAQLG